MSFGAVLRGTICLLYVRYREVRYVLRGGPPTRTTVNIGPPTRTRVTSGNPVLGNSQ